jgi:formate/nitrite transporter FocA (FNT family)
MAEKEPESGTRLTAVEIHENIREPGEKEIQRPAAALLLSALAAGLVMGFSFLASAFASELVSPEHRRAAAAAAYPLGFIFVIMARSELFTENTLVPVVPFLEYRDREHFVKLVRIWGLLLFGNLAGALVFGWALAATPMVEPTLRPALDRLAIEVTSGGFAHVFYAGIFAGWADGAAGLAPGFHPLDRRADSTHLALHLSHLRTALSPFHCGLYRGVLSRRGRPGHLGKYDR